MSNSIVVLREALAPHPGRIKAAFVYGSTAKGEETGSSDIDLIVIGDDVTYSDFYDGFLKVEELLHRPVHAFFLSPNEWKGKLSRGSAFFTKVNAQPKIFHGHACRCSSMTIPELDNLVRVGQVKSEPCAQTEFDGLLRAASTAIADAGNETLAPQSRFALGY